MFEELNYKNILEQMLDTKSKEIDTREGSIFYDTVNAMAQRLAEAFTQASILYEQLQLGTATEESLDLKGAERLIPRREPSKAEYEFLFEGEVPPLGEVFRSEEGYYFTLLQNDYGNYYLESTGYGTIYNQITLGVKAIPEETHDGLISASFGKLIVPAIDEETDDEYRKRIYESMVPGENGNIQHYINWCREASDGVGQARIFPCYDGPNTVVAFITDSGGLPASDEIIAKVQHYIDPDNDGDGIGDGLGEGVANIGAHFRACAPVKATIPVTIIGLEIAPGYTFEDVDNGVKQIVGEYFKELALSDEKNLVIKSSVVGAKIQGLDCVDSFTNISLHTINAPNTYSWTLHEYEIPVVGRVAKK